MFRYCKSKRLLMYLLRRFPTSNKLYVRTFSLQWYVPLNRCYDMLPKMLSSLFHEHIHYPWSVKRYKFTHIHIWLCWALLSCRLKIVTKTSRAFYELNWCENFKCISCNFASCAHFQYTISTSIFRMIFHVTSLKRNSKNT